MIAVLDYGIGNLRSAQKALQKVGGDAHLISHPAQAEGAAGVVLPGVGSFGACMKALRESKLDSVVYSAIEAGLPFLGICVGMQMLYKSSEESPGVKGLRIIDGEIARINGDVKLPQMQWNRLNISKQSALFEGLDSNSWCYFVHSYAAVATPAAAIGTSVPTREAMEMRSVRPVSVAVIATCNYGDEVVAAIERDKLWAVQFHPEKSSSVGLKLLTNFVKQCA